MSRPLVYLDLDRTLYKTSEAGMAIWQKITELYPSVDVRDGHDRQREFYRHDGGAYSYDFAAHAAAVGLDAVAVYRALQASELADGRFEYEGTQQLVDWLRTVADVRVLTYGVDDYQRFKASLCPSLQGVPIETTLRPKGDYLQGKGVAVLVDDKPLHGELPTDVSFIQVVHGSGGPRAVASLEAVMVALKSKL